MYDLKNVLIRLDEATAGNAQDIFVPYEYMRMEELIILHVKRNDVTCQSSVPRPSGRSIV